MVLGLESWVFWVAFAACAYMAWNIGANDVANAMGTSVGSHAITMKQAVIFAAVFEFAGAFLVGADLRETDLRGALLQGSNLRRARLEGAVLSSAEYDAETQWPAGFDPQEHGAHWSL